MADMAYSKDAISSAHSFRHILNAMAKPGQCFNLMFEGEAPSPLFATTAALAQTLFDFQSPVWLSPEFANAEVVEHLKFQTGVKVVNDCEMAIFSILSGHSSMPDLLSFAHGTHEYPDRSCTLIVQIESFAQGDVTLSGPGLKTPVSFSAIPVSSGFWLQMIANHQSYPLGVDIIFASPTQIACCPRSTKITLQEYS